MNSGDRARQFKRFSVGVAIISMAAGACVLIGWAYNISLFKRLISGLTAMVPLTAVGFFLAGAALHLLQQEEADTWQRRAGIFCAGAVGAIGALVLFEYLLVINLGIDLILFPSAVLDEGTLWPGRPAITTCLGLLFSSGALLALNFRSGWLSPLFALTTFFMSFIAILGYAYRIDSFYQIGPSVPIALHTAAMLMVLSLGILSSRPGGPLIRIIISERPGGILARRLLVVSLLLPFLLYMLDSAGQRLGLIPKELSIAVFGVANVLVFVGLILWTAGFLNRLDSCREEADTWLRESEAALKRAQQVANVGSWEWNITTGELFLSDQTYRQLGLPRGEVVRTYEAFQQYIHPDDRAAFVENTERALSGSVPFDMEMRIVQRSGSVRIVDARGDVERGPDGAPQRMGGISLDVTARRRAENSLRKNEERLQAIFESSLAGIFLLDKDGLITFANQSMEDLFGCSMQDLIGSPYVDHIHPDQRSAGGLVMRRLIADEIESGSIERHFIRSDGSEFWGIVSGRRMTDKAKGSVYLIGIVTDITERKKAEESLRKSEEKYRTILETMDEGYGEYDLQGKATYVNDAACRQIGYERDELIGIDYRKIFSPETARHIKETYQRIYQTGKPEYMMDYDVICKDGSIRTHQSNIALMRDPSGEPIGFRSMSRDITERKKAEAEILRLNETLEKRIAERTIQLEAVNEELLAEIEERKRGEQSIKELLAEKELLLKEVHHRIKNNLTVISGLLFLQIKSLRNPEALAAIQDANNRVYSMALLYDKLYRADTFKDTPIKEYLTKLVDEIIGLFPNRSSISLDLKIDDFIVDANILFPLGIILNELITNAMKYAFVGPNGGLLLISVSKKDKHVFLVVQDNGSGPPEEIDTNKPEGFGLKLIGILSNQLGGSFSIERQNGMKCMLEFDI